MQGDPERAGVRISTAEGSAGPVRIRLATPSPFSSTDRALCAAGRRLKKLKTSLQHLTGHCVPGAVVAPVAAVRGDAGRRVLGRRRGRALDPDGARRSPAKRGPGCRAGHGSGDLRCRPELVVDRSLGVRRFRRLERPQEPDGQRVDRCSDSVDGLHTDLHRARRHGGPYGDRKCDSSEHGAPGPSVSLSVSPPVSTLAGRPRSPGAPVTPAAALRRATGAASSQSRVPQALDH